MPTARPVLLVDDDHALRAVLLEQLAFDGEFAPSGAASVTEAEARLIGTTADRVPFPATALAREIHSRLKP